AGIGNVSAEALMGIRRVDGSNQLNGYVDNTGYTPVNASPETGTDPFFWTAEHVPIDDPTARLQNFLTPQWGNVVPFGLNTSSEVRPVAPEPFLLPGVEGTVNTQTRTITLSDGRQLPITPDLVGTVINPGFITQSQEVIDFSANLTDEQKLIAEFWEDGGGTSFPPGTWMTFGQFVSARDDNSIDQDALLFFALGNAVFDAGVATWEAKVFYDYARPVRAIRDLGELGLIGTPGVDEVTGETGNVIRAWTPQSAGTQTILAENFLTYQTPGSDPSPPFAEYTSGHSSFSAAGATVLQAFTGSDEFGGSVTFEAGQSRFEPGITPQQTTTLAWDTFSEAGDEGGISRLYGGIHFEDGDINGRTIGRNVGTAAWTRASGYAGLGQSGFTLLRGSAAGEVLTSPDGALFAAGFEGDDVLVGGNADDVLAGGVGDDVLLGNGGADLYAIAPGEGADVIVDFADGSDRILLNGGLTFESLSFADGTLTVAGVGAVPVAEIRSGSEVLARLANVPASALGAADFLTA
ncbi:MAG: calcium-binding protein, partial [Cyanobacteria bacterium P01_F01_bin.153]